MPPVIRFKRGTLSQLVTAAGAGQLREGEPYHITDLDMNAVGLSTTTYRFDGVLQLDIDDPVPTGYVGAVARPITDVTVVTNNPPEGLGTQAVGTSAEAARADHVHAKSSMFGSSTPAGLGTAAAGTSTDAARVDHVHAKSSVYTFGTAAPSGGADGDLYFQHT